MSSWRWGPLRWRCWMRYSFYICWLELCVSASFSHGLILWSVFDVFLTSLAFRCATEWWCSSVVCGVSPSWLCESWLKWKKLVYIQMPSHTDITTRSHIVFYIAETFLCASYKDWKRYTAFACLHLHFVSSAGRPGGPVAKQEPQWPLYVDQAA